MSSSETNEWFERTFPSLIEPCTPEESTCRVLAQCRTLAAMFMLVTTCSLDQQYGSRGTYTRAADALFRQLRRRYHRCDGHAAAVRILLAMYDLANGCRFVTDSRQTEDCNILSESLISAIDMSLADATTQALCCKLMLYVLYDCTREEDQVPASTPLGGELMKTIERWMAQTDDNAGWPDMDDTTALLRIEVMQMYDYMLLDDRYGEHADRLLAFYQARMQPLLDLQTLPSANVVALALLYETIGSCDSAWTDSARHMGRIADRLRSHAESQVSPQSDEWFICQSVAIHDHIERIADAYQRRLTE